MTSTHAPASDVVDDTNKDEFSPEMSIPLKAM